MILLLLMMSGIISWAIAGPVNWLRDAFDNTLDTAEDIHIDLEHLEHMMYGMPSNNTGSKVAEWDETAGMNPEELGEYAEGDILFPMIMMRSGLSSTTARWPGGIIPYMISPWFDTTQYQLIMEAMEDFHRNTCIRFVPYTGDTNDYIRITAGNTGCWSSVGRIGGRQDVNLQTPGCVIKKGTVIHELMHAVGFIHEQSRYDRDDYVAIQWQNIKPGSDINFKKAAAGTTDPFGVKYDYGSVMHYSSNAFSANGRPTIIPKENKGFLDFFDMLQGRSKPTLGQREGFSKLDIRKIRKMYRCDSSRSYRQTRENLRFNISKNFPWFW
ncbi:zinc metalloproteinase nas-4-like [Chelonus insularis]|uniref:zinc metalloproteinase nas-4-like n=1 Tax=Chelonus insularis TaxID=460826 RepID=UPI00158C08F7|nr:zinc metalloproteinase nas-4-like [Chelonus insularis]